MKSTLASLTLLAALTLSAAARAETPPSVWDVVKDPTARERYDVHINVQQLLYGASDDSPYDRNQMHKFNLDAAARELDVAHAATSTDVRLRMDYLEVTRERSGPSANRLLLPVAQSICHDDAATEEQRATSCFILALIHAQDGRTEEEIETYADVLRFEANPYQRATTIMNRAEGYMRLGQLGDAIEGYREVLALTAPLAQRTDTSTSAYWGLAVALDRYRDPRGALEAANWAVLSDPELLLVTPKKNPNVIFFVPSWDEHWYQALGYRAKSLQPGLSAFDVARYLGKAEDEYRAYVLTAGGAADIQYLVVAKERLETVKKLHADALSKAPKSRVPSDGGHNF